MAWLGFRWAGNVANGAASSQEQGDDRETKNGILEKRDSDELLKFIENDMIGKDAIFEGPYGPRRILYADYVASGKALHSIEQFMLDHVLTTYGNTHTHSTVTSAQTTSFRDEAKNIIREALCANEEDVIIFTGSGVTGAISKLIQVLNLDKPPVVFCGPFEHHSNLLPWREMDGQVVNISETSDGKVNLRHLEVALRKWANSERPLIGSFSAASNITGITTDTRKVAALLHKYGAISLWDYATGAPYLDINIHPDPIDGVDTSKDAVFISMHKFVGSPDAPGLLVASKHLFKNPVPTMPGGGTVLFVSETDHRYLKDIESREEGGTPAIIGSIRAGLAFKLKMLVGTSTIMERETELYKRAMSTWSSVPELEILGILEENISNSEHKLAVFSFLIRHLPTGYYLHHNFVTTLLNDLFGIQTRGGCACAGAYAQHLLGIDHAAEKRFGRILEEDPKRAKVRNPNETERTEYEILRPGFTRLNFPYFISDEDADFIINAVVMVAKHGWSLLQKYQYKPREGSWNHRDFVKELEIKKIEDLQFHSDGLPFCSGGNQSFSKDALPTSKTDCLKRAERVFLHATELVGKSVEDQRAHFSKPGIKDLRWFLMPYEAQEILKGKAVKAKDKLIFKVRKDILPLTEDEIERNSGDVDGLTLAQQSHVFQNQQNGNAIMNGNGHLLTNVRAINGGIASVQNNKKKKNLLRKIFCRTKNSVDVMGKTSTET